MDLDFLVPPYRPRSTGSTSRPFSSWGKCHTKAKTPFESSQHARLFASFVFSSTMVDLTLLDQPIYTVGRNSGKFPEFKHASLGKQGKKGVSGLAGILRQRVVAYLSYRFQQSPKLLFV